MTRPCEFPITLVETVLEVDVPAEFEQVKVKLFEPSESGVIVSDPDNAFDPDHDPDAEHDVAFVVDHERVTDSLI